MNVANARIHNYTTGSVEEFVYYAEENNIIVSFAWKHDAKINDYQTNGLMLSFKD